MNFPKDEQLCLWSRNLSIAAALVVCLLNWLNGNTFKWMVFRTVITFLIMYGLTRGCLACFRKTANARSNEVMDQENRMGNLLDVSLGDNDPDQTGQTTSKQNSDQDEINSESNKTGAAQYAGQVDPALVNGVVSDKQQADIIRRMGWKEE
jgi:hypothetical protein